MPISKWITVARRYRKQANLGHVSTTVAQGPGQWSPFWNMWDGICLGEFVSVWREEYGILDAWKQHLPVTVHNKPDHWQIYFIVLFTYYFLKNVPHISFILAVTITTLKPH